MLLDQIVFWLLLLIHLFCWYKSTVFILVCCCMTFSRSWVCISFWFLVLWFFLYYKNLLPKFVLPIKIVSGSRYWMKRIVSWNLFLLILLLPLDIWIVSDKIVSVESPTPVQIVFDVSLSMSAQDLLPSRFSLAKAHLMDVVARLDWYAISLITFSGIPFVYIPFSYDTSAILQKLSLFSLSDFPAVPEFVWTALWDALILGISNMLSLSEKSPWVILLITDGDNNKWYDVDEVLPLLVQQGISVSVLAIGWNDYLIWYDQTTQPIVTSINLPLLHNIAAQTSGLFSHVLSTWDISYFFDQFFSFIKEREVYTIHQEYRYAQNSLLFLLFFHLLFFLGFQSVFLFQNLKKN